MRACGARTVLATPLVLVLAGGCATDDPQAGGFLGGVAGLASGQYERDLRGREDRLASVQAEQWRLDTDERILTAEREGLRVTIAVREREADDLAGQALQLQDEIDGLRRTLARTQARRTELEAEIARLGEAPAEVRSEEGTAAAVRQRELESLLAEMAALTEELAALERAAAEEAELRAELRAEIERLKEELARPYPRAEAFGN